MTLWFVVSYMAVDHTSTENSHEYNKAIFVLLKLKLDNN